MIKFRVLAVAFSATLLSCAVPAAAQSQQKSDSREFVEAVRTKDGRKVNEYLQDKTSRVLNMRDKYSGEAALHVIAKLRLSEYLPVFLGQDEINVNVLDKDDNTPLILAVNSGWDSGVSKLLQKKANVNLVNASGESALIRAVLLHQGTIVQLLLDAGADPDKADYNAGLSAREYAIRENRYPLIAKQFVDVPRGGKGKAKAAAAAGPGL